MRSDERVEDSIERRLACLKDLNDKKLELKNQRLREAVDEISSGGDLVIATFEEPDSDLEY